MMTRLKSELEVTCPCCQSTLVIDTNLGRVVGHKPDWKKAYVTLKQGDKIEFFEGV